MDELLTMSKQEITRLEAMQRIKDKRLTQKEAARMLKLSVRQIKRLYKAYKAKGAKGLISARRGKPSNHRLEAQVEQRVLDLLQEKYVGFGPTLAHEKLTEVHGIGISRESVRQLMIAEGLWKPKRAKQAALRTRCENDVRASGNWCRSTARIMPGSKTVDQSVRCWCTLTMLPGKCWSCGSCLTRPFLPTVKLLDIISSVMASQ